MGALLHDTLEDTSTTAQDISERFGEKVLQYVQECSDDKTLTKKERKIQQIKHASQISVEAQQIKLADKYSNLFDLDQDPPSFWSKEEMQGYWYWSYAVCRVCFEALPSLSRALETLFAKHCDLILSEEALQDKLDVYYEVIEHTE